MSKTRTSSSHSSSTSRQSLSNSFLNTSDNSFHDSSHPPRKTNRERRFDSTASNEQDPLEDGKILVLKVIGKINLRIERKDYQDLIRIVNQIPGDVIVLMLDNLLIESLYADIPSSLASLAALYSKIWYDRKGRLPDHGCSTDEFVHHLLRYFADVLKHNSQTYASAGSREHMKTIFRICTQMDETLRERLIQRTERFSKALSGFTEHTSLEAITRSSETRYMKIHEALKTEMERTINHYKSALQKLSDKMLKVPIHTEETSSAISGRSSETDLKDRAASYMRTMSGQAIEDRLYFNQSVLSAVQIKSSDQLLVNGLIEKLEKRIDHDKIVLQLLSQLRKEFKISRDEKVLPLLERFHHGYRLVLQLLEESLKGVTKPKVPTITCTLASGSEGDGESEEGSDVFDTVTQLDDDTEFSAFNTDTSFSETDTTQGEESGISKVRKNEGTQQKKDQNFNLQKQLHQKQKDLEEAQEMVRYLKKKERSLTDRLQEQAQRHLKKGGKFEDLSAGECRPSALIKRYDNLFTQTRLDAMDELDEVESLNLLDDSEDLKNKILFSVMVVAYRTVQHSLAEKQRRLKKLLDLPTDEERVEQAQDMQESITDYFRRTGARLNIDSIKRDVSKQLWSTLYDFPELQNCAKLKEFISECVRLSWMLAVQIPPMSIEYEATDFTDSLHGRFMNSEMTKVVIKYHVWPALIDSQTGHVVYKGMVVT
ncbi:meiosis-specific nuclear structural protein 1-like [Montipora capricornis]|uniref:meiosis-specific nuclear structural protein 1-like n=1 Tax=Montipora capricornis TaxID=246305 RepID=UPI0035F1A813